MHGCACRSSRRSSTPRAFIEEAIDSVLAQTFASWELLLVDDGSTDGSTAIAHALAAAHPGQIRYLSHERARTGAPAPRGTWPPDHARGEYLAFLDADDVYLPHKLEAQVPLLDAHPDVGVLYAATEYWYSWTGRPEDAGRDWTWRRYGVDTGHGGRSAAAAGRVSARRRHRALHGQRAGASRSPSSRSAGGRILPSHLHRSGLPRQADAALSCVFVGTAAGTATGSTMTRRARRSRGGSARRGVRELSHLARGVPRGTAGQRRSVSSRRCAARFGATGTRGCTASSGRPCVRQASSDLLERFAGVARWSEEHDDGRSTPLVSIVIPCYNQAPLSG